MHESATRLTARADTFDPKGAESLQASVRLGADKAYHSFVVDRILAAQTECSHQIDFAKSRSDQRRGPES